MDIRQLRYFTAIVESGSFSRAAAQLHVAQPALSQHVRAMEASLGVALLHRNPRGVVPTEAGLRLLERARVIGEEFAALGDYVRGSVVPRGEVRFGMPATINERIGVPLIEAVRARHPEVRVRISEAMSGFVVDWLRGGVVDIALVYDVSETKGLTLHHALTEEICLFGAPDMDAGPAGRSTTLASALRLPLILPGRGHGLRELIETAADTIGKTVAPAIEIDSYQQIKQLAARRLAFGLLPATAVAQEVAQGQFDAWRITRPPLMRNIHLAHPAGRPLSVAAEAVVRLTWTILKDQVHSDAWSASWVGRARFS